MPSSNSTVGGYLLQKHFPPDAAVEVVVGAGIIGKLSLQQRHTISVRQLALCDK